MNYKGHEIRTSKGGGKAGRSLNKTATVQVIERLQHPNYLLKKQIRYTVGNPESLFKATQKAREFIDNLVVKSDAQASAKTDAGAQNAQ